MKKIFTYVLTICLIVPCLFFLNACSCDEKSENTLKMSLNPQVTFVVEGEEIVSVSYDNQDAGTIYANINFVGKNIEEAVKIFVEQSAISGHINLSGDEVAIEVNGSVEADIKALEDTAKQEVENVFAKLGVDVQVTVAELSETARKTALVETAKVLSPEKTTTELNALTNEELISLIKEKQKQFEGLAYNQISEIQSAFSYAQNAVLQAIETARATIEQIETQIESLGSLAPDNLKAQINTLKAEIEQKITEFLTAKQNEITAAKAHFETKKAELVNTFKTEVENYKTTFESHLNSVKQAGTITEEQFNYWKNLIEANEA